jgi:hypothetical protein
MTESEWLVCADPTPMLASLRGWASDRKLRLFSVACCRRIWPALQDGSHRDPVSVAERYADQVATLADLEAANRTAHRSVKDVPYGDAYWADPACMVTHEDPWDAAYCVEYCVSCRTNSRWYENRAIHCGLIRDVFGNPFRSVALDPAWETPQILALSRAIYDERTFDRLLVLADALEDAGCRDADILGHCRGPGPHARGCWVVDLILGKE